LREWLREYPAVKYRKNSRMLAKKRALMWILNGCGLILAKVLLHFAGFIWCDPIFCGPLSMPKRWKDPFF